MRVRSATWSELGVADPSPITYSTDRCPVCKGSMYELSRTFFCSNEDAHRGGVLVTFAGRAKRLDGGTIPPPI